MLAGESSSLIRSSPFFSPLVCDTIPIFGLAVGSFLGVLRFTAQPLLPIPTNPQPLYLACENFWENLRQFISRQRFFFFLAGERARANSAR